MNFDGSNVNLVIAFVSGVVTFFASCLLPLVPTYLAYLAGVKTSEPNQTSTTKNKMMVNSLFFTLGFIVVFVVMGATSHVVGGFFASNRILFQRVGGVFFIILALFMLGIIKPIFLLKERKLHTKRLTRWNKVNSLIVGLIFGFAWTPCIGPVLAVILFWASQTETLIKGMTLLLVYGIGLGLPFFIIGSMFDYLSPKLSRANTFGTVLNKIAALIILIMGVLLLLNKSTQILFYLTNLLSIETLTL